MFTLRVHPRADGRGEVRPLAAFPTAACTGRYSDRKSGEIGSPLMTGVHCSSPICRLPIVDGPRDGRRMAQW